MSLPESHQKTIAKIVEIIKNTVGADLVSIIIFGSFVRGEFTEKSDYDMLIVISDYEDVKCKNYWKKIKDLVYKEFRRLIDAIFIEESALKDLTNPFTLDVLADGKVVYGKEVLDKEVFKRYHIQPILNLERVLELDGEFRHKEEARALAKLAQRFTPEIIREFSIAPPAKRSGISWALSKAGKFTHQDIYKLGEY